MSTTEGTTMTEITLASAPCKVSYAKIGHCWAGVLKVDGQEVWRCTHHHKNRDQSTKWSGQSAQDCAKGEALRRGWLYY